MTISALSRKVEKPLWQFPLQVHMPDLSYLRNEIVRMRNQIQRQRREIKDLERGGHSTKSANELLERMLARTDGMCAERDRQIKEQKLKYPGTDKAIKGPAERRRFR